MGWCIYKKRIQRHFLDSIRHCQKEKRLKLYGWCLMSNHVHLLARAKNENLSDIIRDFKKFTSKQIIKAIEENERESRREWMLRIFKEQGEKNSRNKDNQFWRQSLSRSAGIINQKIFTIQNSAFKNWPRYITMRLKQDLYTKQKNIYTAVQEIIFMETMLACSK